MTIADARTVSAALSNLPPAEAFARGVALLKADEPEALLPQARRLHARYPADARLAQLLGLAARATGDGPLAYRAFTAAARLAPSDALIAHAHARATLEAGYPASALFEKAQALAPSDGSVLQGLAAALTAEGRAHDALSMLTRLLTANPQWLDGHRSYARIAAQYGQDPAASLRAALAAQPGSAALQQALIAILLEARALDAVPRAIGQAEQALGTQPWLTRLAAHAASEGGDLARADALFAAAPAPTDAGDAALLARHHLRAARPEAAIVCTDTWLSQAGAAIVWPYRALAWRLTGDPRSHWLEGDEGLVGIYDLAPAIPDLAALLHELRALHHATSPPIDQSVRGGTQTDGNLLLRDTPAIQALRAAVLTAAERHIAALPQSSAGHPTLLPRRDPLRIAGAWSGRLTGAGYHTDHVHSEGWFSSALYLALPEVADAGSDAHAGWLQLGTSRELTPALAPTRLVEPKPLRLVLFPSIMWHGTLPFVAGERLTVAFDIARPRQDERAR